jgi:hypothetical protein
VHRLTEQVPELIRSEPRLAQAELKEKGKSAGIGVGAFGAAGLLSLYGVACLLAAATPPAPERAISGLKEDVATVKGGHR